MVDPKRRLPGERRRSLDVAPRRPFHGVCVMMKLANDFILANHLFADVLGLALNHLRSLKRLQSGISDLRYQQHNTSCQYSSVRL